ncbi:MAG TPA: desulfoferrodoxin [Bacillota bacterium]|nr:desulfoferrodoxin [Bacillota bacterium]
MTQLLEIYRCEICGNVVEILHTGKGALVCCGEPMGRMEERTADTGYEKHVPVREGSVVKVGSVEHPMIDAHYIEWIELIGDKGLCRKFLKPGDRPIADFAGATGNIAREYCNIHGLWKG